MARSISCWSLCRSALDLLRGAGGPIVDPPSEGPSEPIFQEALREQLGIKLESQKGSVDVLVVDRIEHPSDN